MRELLGLSLTANSVVCTLVDPMDGTIVADDVVEVDSTEEVTNAAAHSVAAFTSHTERNVDAVRIAWSEGTAGSAGKLTSKLRLLGFRDIDVISEDEARQSRNRTARYIDPPLELAYGAARSIDADNTPLRLLPARRVSMAAVSTAVVLAVGAAAAGYLLLSRPPMKTADHASAPVAAAPPPDHAPVIPVPAAAPPPPPAPVAPPVVPEVPPLETAEPVVADEPDVPLVSEAETPTDTAPKPSQAATMARQPRPAAAVPAPVGFATVPETAPLPNAAEAPVPAPASAVIGQPHLTPEALSARLLPGPVPPPISVVRVPAPLPAPPNPLDILAALP